MSRRKLREKDRIIGRNIAKARKLRGLTQSGLGRSIDVSYQQIQKYEAGINRISAAALWDISDVLEFDITFFYSGLSEGSSALEELAGECSPPLS